jgi:hypothetical protein
MIVNKKFIVSVDFITDAMKPNISIYDTAFTIEIQNVEREKNYYCIVITDSNGIKYKKYYDQNDEEQAKNYHYNAFSNLDYISI